MEGQTGGNRVQRCELVNGELVPNVDVSAGAEPEANAHAFETIRANFRPENLKKPIQPSQPTGKVPTC